jgi:beta-phosphoglucomutase-like phosphatase (HAD superfamily)
MAKSGLPAIRACLFDMDGLLINSEDLYTICTNEVLREFGKPDLPWNIKAQLQGRPGPEVSTFPKLQWLGANSLTWTLLAGQKNKKISLY